MAVWSGKEIGRIKTFGTKHSEKLISLLNLTHGLVHIFPIAAMPRSPTAPMARSPTERFPTGMARSPTAAARSQTAAVSPTAIS